MAPLCIPCFWCTFALFSFVILANSGSLKLLETFALNIRSPLNASKETWHTHYRTLSFSGSTSNSPLVYFCSKTTTSLRWKKFCLKNCSALHWGHPFSFCGAPRQKLERNHKLSQGKGATLLTKGQTNRNCCSRLFSYSLFEPRTGSPLDFHWIPDFEFENEWFMSLSRHF